MTKHKVSKLTGYLLDAAVALADGRLVVKDEPRWPRGDYKRLRKEWGGEHVVRWYATDDTTDQGKLGGWEPLDNQGSPSTDWAIGGPIIERKEIHLGGYGSSRYAEIRDDAKPWVKMWGDTPLVAAMRAHVVSELGEEVDLP